MRSLKHFTARTKMADMIAANYTLILVLPRFGLSPGFGEKSVQEVCDQQGVDVGFVLMICNIYTFDDFLPDEELLLQTDMRLLVSYLRASHDYYIRERLPHIGRHLTNIAERAGIRYGTILRNFFAEYEQEVRLHFLCEEDEVFPYLEEAPAGGDTPEGICTFEESHAELVDKLTDLTQIVYKYIPGDGMAEELSELVFAVMQLSSDLQKHALIEEKIVLPYLAQMGRRNR